MIAAVAQPPSSRIEITRPARMSSLPDFMQALEQMCRQVPVAGEARDDLRVALEEACSNVINHAFAGRQAGDLTLVVEEQVASGGPAVALVLQDRGMAFNPLTVPAPDVAVEAQDRAIGGLGVHLIRQMTDEQSYVHSDAGGNRFTLVKYLPGPRAA